MALFVSAEVQAALRLQNTPLLTWRPHVKLPSVLKARAQTGPQEYRAPDKTVGILRQVKKQSGVKSGTKASLVHASTRNKHMQIS